MVMVGVDSGSLQAKLFGLFWGSAAASCRSAFIKWTGRTHTMALPWWQHHKHWHLYYCVIIVSDSRRILFLKSSGDAVTMCVAVTDVCCYGNLGDVSKSLSVDCRCRRQQHQTDCPLESRRRPAAPSGHVTHRHVAGQLCILIPVWSYLPAVSFITAHIAVKNC